MQAEVTHANIEGITGAVAVAALCRDYPAAVRACVRAGGDMGTTAAIIGGIVATHIDDTITCTQEVFQNTVASIP